MLDETQLQRLASMANALRPDWPTNSIHTHLTKNHSDKAFRDLAVALAYIAADQHTSTPARLNEPGPWWQAAQAGTHPTRTTPGIHPGTSTTRDTPTKRCEQHPWEPADTCRACRSEAIAVPPGQVKQTPRPTVPAPPTPGRVREILARAAEIEARKLPEK